MYEKPLVSIVLPSYNGAEYIRQSIDSIKNQSFTAWELILVNDCSEDNTLDIMNKYAADDSRIHVINNTTNQRLPKSLNIGFARAKGEYLTWTSDDNKYLTDALVCMVEWLQLHPDIPLICADYSLIDEDGALIHGMKPRPFNEHTLLIEPTVGACFMYRREVLDELGGYDETAFCAEDHEYWQRIWKKYHHVGHIAKDLYRYRVQRNSLSATMPDKVLYQRAALHKRNWLEILDYFRNEPQYLCQVYYDMLQGGNDYEKECLQLLGIVDELNDECFDFNNHDFVIFGAGKLGKEVRKILPKETLFYIDNDVNKQNTILDGIRIISLKEYLEIKESSEIIISIWADHIYEIIRQLKQAGIKKYYSIYGLRKSIRNEK